jgi:hypothetical protein
MIPMRSIPSSPMKRRADTCRLPRLRGHVEQWLTKPGGSRILLHAGHNDIVFSSLEIVLAALLAQDSIQNIQFGLTGERPITQGIRTIGTPVATAPINSGVPTVISKDSNGLCTIATVTAVITPVANLTYDTLGLTSSTGLLFSATTFGSTTIDAADTLSVQWTILLNGA